MGYREETLKAEEQVQGCPHQELMWAWVEREVGSLEGQSGDLRGTPVLVEGVLQQDAGTQAGCTPLQPCSGRATAAVSGLCTKPFVMADPITAPVIPLGCFALFLRFWCLRPVSVS